MGWRTKVKRREMNVVGRLCGQSKTSEVAIKRSSRMKIEMAFWMGCNRN